MYTTHVHVLTVAVDNPAAIALYMKSGFVTIEAFPTYRILEWPRVE